MTHFGVLQMSNDFAVYDGSLAQSGAVDPMLMRMYRAHGRAGDDTSHLSFGERIELCDDVANLIATSDKVVDREMATDILITLLRHAEKSLKKALAERFSIMENVPLRLILKFVNDDIDVASSVLKYSKALNDLDLIYIIQSRDSPFWQVIATRPSLGVDAVDALADTGDLPTARNLVQNNDIGMTDYALRRVMVHIEQDESLAHDILARSDVGAEFIKKIYAIVGDAVKDIVIQKTGRLNNDAGRAVDEVIAEFTEPQQSVYMPTSAMLKAADLFLEQGKINPRLMLEALRRGQMAAFVAQFSRYASLPVAAVIPMVQQKDGQSLGVACRAGDMTQGEFANIYRAIHGNSTMIEVSDAIAYFDSIASDVAKRLMAQSRH